MHLFTAFVKASVLALIFALLTAGCRSEKVAFRFQAPPRVARPTTETAAALLLPTAARPAPLPPAPKPAGPTRKLLAAPPAKRTRAAVAGSATQRRRRGSVLARRAHSETQGLDPVQRGAVRTLLIGAAVAALGFLLLSIVLSGSGASLPTVLLVVGLYVGGLTAAAIGIGVLLVATLLKLLQRN